MLFVDDGISMDSQNENIWVHHCDFFYGKPGSDDDQVKGDGTVDMKYDTSFVTLSYNHPMMINMQGTNYSIWPNGEQAGGMTKAFDNFVDGAAKLVYQTEDPVEFDAYLVTSRAQQLPASVKSKTGGNTYSNFDTAPTMYQYTPHAAKDVPANVTAWAGRMNGGDFEWKFTAADDASSAIDAELKAPLTAYESPLEN